MSSASGNESSPSPTSGNDATRIILNEPLGYQIFPKPIGRGAYGEVYLARKRDGDYCAVKVVYRVTFNEARPYEREFEGILKFEPISRLSQSQLQILRVGRREEAGYFYYIMELADDVSGQRSIQPDTYVPRTLQTDLQQAGGRLSARQCCEIGLALSIALENLHKHRLVHRDIKPANIIFVQGQPKLADPGLVTDSDQTMTCVGTEGYIPPEGPGSPRADIYALGMVLYEAFSGFKRREFPKLPTNLEDLSDHGTLVGLNRVIMRACQAESNKRYQSATELRRALEKLLPPKTAPTSAPGNVPFASGRNRTLWIAATVGLLLLAIALAWMNWLKPKSPLEQASVSGNMNPPLAASPEIANFRPSADELGELPNAETNEMDATADYAVEDENFTGLRALPDGSLYAMNLRARSLVRLLPEGRLQTLATLPEGEGKINNFGYDARTGTFFCCSAGLPRQGQNGALYEMTPGGKVTRLAGLSTDETRRPTGMIAHPMDHCFYGITRRGGEGNFGQVLRMTRGGKVEPVGDFKKTNGSLPWPGLPLVVGSDGRMFGTTEYGGDRNNGTIFSVTTNGVITLLHSFRIIEGKWPLQGLLQYTNDVFYGTACSGGGKAAGTIFRINANGKFERIYAFQGSDGKRPHSLIRGRDGNIYGATAAGGANNFGTLFRVTPTGELTTLHTFNGTNGALPQAIAQAADGQIYGTTKAGGKYFDGNAKTGQGIIFRLTLLPDGRPEFRIIP